MRKIMIYVMSDIHGDLKKYRSVMSKINLQDEDHLYILGNVINRYLKDGYTVRTDRNTQCYHSAL